jgi:hypothetical protein
MPKQNVNSRNNWLDISGLVDYADARLDQYVLSTSDVTFNTLVVTTDATIGNDLTVTGDTVIHGDLTVTGNATIVDTNITTFKDNILLINSTETGTGVTANLSGIEVDRGSLVNYQSVFQESTQFFKIGQVGSLQCVATREDAPLHYGAMIFNPTLQRLDSTQTFPLQMFFNVNQNSTSSVTGSVVVTGGIGASGNCYIDGTFAFKGTNYQNNITSNGSNDFILNVGNNLYLQLASSKSIYIPINVNTVIGSTIISNDNINLTIQNNTGAIRLTSNSNVTLPSNVYLNWGNNNSNSIIYDGTNMNINASNLTNINSILNITNNTITSSPNTGSIVTLGGIGIQGTTNATNSTNGGALSVKGGTGIQGSAYIGTTLIVADTSLVTSQLSGQGVNFRSLNRTLSTNTNTDILFNTFEGGTINGSSIVITNSSTVYISSAPTIIGGGTLNNAYALYIAAGDVYFGNSSLTINGTIPTTSYTTGTFLLSGGLAINLAQNAISVTNGGSFGTAGGMAVGMDGYFGGKIDIGNTGVSLTQLSNVGVNLKSNGRTITTTSVNNITFNSFEGGIVNTTASILYGSTVYIGLSPTTTGGGSLINSYALWISTSPSRFDGKIYMTDPTFSSSNTTGSLIMSGSIAISNITNATSSISGGSITTAGGIASAKTIYAGSGYYSVNGIGNHLTMQNTNLNRFSMNLLGAESSGNAGSNFTINRYNDAGILIDYPLSIERSTGIVSIIGTTSSTSSSTGQLIINGGSIGITSTTNAVSYLSGGSLTSAGGFAFDKDGYVNGNLYINTSLNSTTGISNFGQTNINTNNGILSITGSNSMIVNTSAISLTSNTTNITLSSATNTNITSNNGGVALSATTASTFNVSVGTLGFSSVGMTINGNSGVLNIQNTNTMNINSGSGALNFITTNTGTGLRIATTGTGVPVTIGDALSMTTLSGNLTIGGNLTVNGDTTTVNSTLVTINDIAFVVNNRPTGISDGGFLIHRYQTPNDTGLGQVVGDPPKVTGVFGTGSTTPDTLVLTNTASSVNNYYAGWWIQITSGAGLGQVRRISSYVGSTYTITLYSTLNNNDNNDGLDLTVAPSAGDTYALYDIPYAGIYYSATNREMRFAGVPFDQESGTFGTPTTYLGLHCQSMILEDYLIVNSNLNVLFTNTEAFIVGQDNATNNTQYNFIVDTVTGNVNIQNTVNTLNSTTGIYFNQLDSTSARQTYSRIYSQISSNTSGSIVGKLLFNTTINGTSTDMMLLNGATSTIDFNYQVKLLANTATTSSSSGALLVSGGIAISNATDATSLTSGGSFYTSGGASITKSMFIGGQIYQSNTTKVGSGNTLTGIEGNTNLNGDLVLYNSTSQGIYFNGSGSGVPSYTTRSLGSKIIYKPALSGSSCDYATGIATTSLWNSVPTSSTFDYYIGTSNYLTLNSSGILLNVNNTGIKFSNNTNIYLNSTSSNLHYVPVGSFAFRNVADTADNITFSNNGLITLGLSNINITPSITGSIFNISSLTFTDNVTANSGTTSNFTISSNLQSTLSASNTSVTTTTAINSYFGGALIKGTNQSITNDYNIYIAQGSSIGTVTNAYSLYIQDSPTGTITNAYALYIDGSGKNYINGILTIGNTTQIAHTSNTISSTAGALNINGDIIMYNATKQTIYFNTVGSSVPAFTTRSAGTKIVLLPNISGSSVDYALGINSSTLWYSVSDTTCNHSWYLGTSRRLILDNTGLVFTSSGSNVHQKMNVDTTGMSICGGSTIGNGSGAQIDLYGNTSGDTGNLTLNTGTAGIMTFYTGGTLAMTISNTGNVSLTSVTDANGTANVGSFYTPGGINVEKSCYIGTNLVLNFNQTYIYTGDSSGRLNITSGTTSVANRIREFTFDANNTTDNVTEIYGTGKIGSLTNTEFLTLGYNVSTTNYIISTKATGTGTVRPLVLQTGVNTNQMILNNDGSINLSTVGTTLTTQKLYVSDATDATPGAGSVVVDGGVYIAKKLIVGTTATITGAFSAGVATQTITVSSLVNTGTVTPQNTKTIVNTSEVTLSSSFTFTPTAANTLTSFIISLPLVTTNFVNIYDTVININGFCNDGSGNFIDIENCRCFPIIGTTTAKVVFTSGSNISVSNGHIINIIARYTQQ